jgi:putative Mn2+ efflux pump MntP
MDIITVLFIAVGLSMDAFAVSVTSGLTIKRLRVGHALRIAMFFGLFQAVMPLVGWLAGFSLRDFISGVDHWIAFGLLSIIGIKMIYEAGRMKSDEKRIDPLNIYFLLLLSVATSIDALAVGFSLSLLNVSIITPAVIIGIVTFLLSLSGVFIGDRLGHFFESRIEVAGGLILIGIGVKILIEHLT